MLRMFLCFDKWVPTDKNCLLSLFQKAFTPFFVSVMFVLISTNLLTVFPQTLYKKLIFAPIFNSPPLRKTSKYSTFPFFRSWLAHLFLSQKLQHFSATTSAFHVFLFYAFLTLPAYFLLCVKFLKALAHLIPCTASAESPHLPLLCLFFSKAFKWSNLSYFLFPLTSFHFHIPLHHLLLFYVFPHPLQELSHFFPLSIIFWLSLIKPNQTQSFFLQITLCWFLIFLPHCFPSGSLASPLSFSKTLNDFVLHP